MQPDTRPLPRGFEGWRGTLLVASTYSYFLIFAQFGFLERLTQAGLADAALQPVMAAMAGGGIVASLVAARRPAASAALRLRLALLGCASAAALALLPLRAAGFAAVALLTGLSLGTLTVTLVSHLIRWTGARHPVLNVGLGTGLGYFLCNVPALFNASPRHIALAAAAVSLAGLAASSPHEREAEAAPQIAGQALPFALVLAWFIALVWLDSAAFFIIQNAPALKSGAWMGAAHLWRTGGIHFIAALAGVWLLARRGLVLTLALAFACLAGACLLLRNPAQSVPAALLYPAGVSLYSVALVACPALLIRNVSPGQRSRRAGWLYAVAGWIGSALGIGMAQHLHRIPVWFVAAATALFLLPAAWLYGRSRWREALAVMLVLAAAWGMERAVRHPSSALPLTPAERGRRVYISEGCIHCHSQYVRPHSRDVELWGPAGNVEAIRREKPPLIGNRRQGPDLTNVGSRRSPLWLRIHTIDPRAVSYGSIMPGYAYLFHDQRGPDLVAYLSSLRSPDSAQHLQQEIATWRPASSSAVRAGHFDGARLFRDFCATCHAPQGYVRSRWGQDFHPAPLNLTAGSLAGLPAGETPAQLRLRLARIVKFGLPGTNMPGHEYLPDAQILAIADYVASLHR